MSIVDTIIFKSLVKPFYKQNAGLFAFLLFIMIAAVGRANEAGLLEYHLSLIQGIMTNRSFLLFTLWIWFLYELKCAQFVFETLGKKDYVFLSLVSAKKPACVFRMLLSVNVMLLLPVLLYAFIAVWIGVLHHWWLHVIIVVFFFIFLSITGAFWYQSVFNHPGKSRSPAFLQVLSFSGYSFYWLFLVRYIWTSRRTLFLVIKIFSCLMLYGMIFNQKGDQSGIQMGILFYSFGLLGHGVLIYTIRGMEETSMVFYRGLPVSLFERFLQYGLLYFFLFIPEIIIIGRLAPAILSYSNAIVFIFFGCSVLLFLNSLLFIRFFKKFDYLKIVTGLFLIIYVAVLPGIFPILCAGLCILSVYIFFIQYYRFERS